MSGTLKIFTINIRNGKVNNTMRCGVVNKIITLTSGINQFKPGNYDEFILFYRIKHAKVFFNQCNFRVFIVNIKHA